MVRTQVDHFQFVEIVENLHGIRDAVRKLDSKIESMGEVRQGVSVTRDTYNWFDMDREREARWEREWKAARSSCVCVVMPVHSSSFATRLQPNERKGLKVALVTIGNVINEDIRSLLDPQQLQELKLAMNLIESYAKEN